MSDQDQPEIITAKHFIAEKADYDKNGDVRDRIAKLITVDTLKPPAEPQARIGRVYCDWFHYDLQGVLTEEMFQDQLSQAIEALARQINQHEDPFRPVRLQTAPPKLDGMGYIDWMGAGHPFDIRVIVVFGTFIEPTTELPTAGLHFFLSTVVQYDEKSEQEEGFQKC